jgi:hypothetical protein
MGAGEVDQHAVPEDIEGAGVLIVGIRGGWFGEVAVEEALCGQPYLEFLLGVDISAACGWRCVVGGFVGSRLCVGGGGRGRWLESHAEVGADNVDDGLPVLRVVLAEAFE